VAIGRPLEFLEFDGTKITVPRCSRRWACRWEGVKLAANWRPDRTLWRRRRL